MTRYVARLTPDQIQQLFKILGIKFYPYGFRQGTTKSIMKDTSTLYYSYNHNIGYSKAVYLKDFDIRIARNGQNKLFNEIPLTKTHIIKYFKFMYKIYGNDYYLHAVALLGEDRTMLSLLYQAKTGQTEKDDEVLSI